MNDHARLARTAMASNTGGNVNYYLVEVPRSRLGASLVAEVEDVIEALAMLFSEGNAFKAAVRMAKLRQDLGKPGSSRRYEVEKAVYYADRTLAQALRRAEGRPGGNVFALDLVIRVPSPKRLDPYEVHLDDLVDALAPTADEAELIRSIVAVCIVRRDLDAPSEEVRFARRACDAASRLAVGLQD